MPIYSETLSNSVILKMLGCTAMRILIIGCGACMNESLAYKNHLPIFKESSDIPYATVVELERLREMLAHNGHQVETKYYNNINGFYCMTDISIDEYPTDWNITPDIILLLSCKAGYDGLRFRLPEANILLIAKLLGGVPYVYKDEGDQRFLIDDKSKVQHLDDLEVR